MNSGFVSFPAIRRKSIQFFGYDEFLLTMLDVYLIIERQTRIPMLGSCRSNRFQGRRVDNGIQAL